MPRGVYSRADRNPQAVKTVADAPSPIEPSVASAPSPTTIETPALSQRATEERRERRLRNPADLDRMAEMKLAIPPEVQERLTREGKTARWVLDKPNRLERLHRQDWDVTPGIAPIPDANDGLSLVLHEKYQDWFDEDQKAKAKSLDEKDKAVARGKIDGSGTSLEQDEFNRELTRTNRIGR